MRRVLDDELPLGFQDCDFLLDGEHPDDNATVVATAHFLQPLPSESGIETKSFQEKLHSPGFQDCDFLLAGEHPDDNATAVATDHVQRNLLW